MKQLDAKDLNLGQEVWTPEHAQAAQAQIRDQIRGANLNTTKLQEIGEWAERVINDPSQFPAFQDWLREQGLPESEIPDTPDYQELAAMATMGRISGEVDSETEQNQAPTTGPISPDQLAGLAQQGRSGDTMLAHINPEEAAVLENMGGMGTINPATGLPEYGFFSDLWKGVKRVVKTVAPFVLPVMALVPGLQPLIPALGAAVGLTGAAATIAGSAIIAGGVTALSGGSIKDILTSAGMTALGQYLTPIMGDYLGNLTGVTDVGLKSIIGSAAYGAGVAALRGGTVTAVLTAAASGAAGSYLGQVASNAINSGSITNPKITQKVFDDAVFAAADARGLADAGLTKNQITQTLMTTGLAPAVASTAATAAVAGQTADQIAVNLSNQYASVRTGGSSQPSLYGADASGATNSVIGGANQQALETVQRYEDSLLRADQANTILQQARSEGITGRQALTDRLVRELTADGMDQTSANYVAENLINGYSVGQVAGGLVDYLPNSQLYGPTQAQTTEVDQNIRNWLSDRPGATDADIRTALQQTGLTEVDFQRATGMSIDDYLLDGAVVNPVNPGGTDTSVNTDYTTPDSIDEYLNQSDTSGDTVLPTTEVVADAEPGFNDFVPEQQPGGNISEAQFFADDAVQLAAQTNNNTAAIQQNLEYAGMDPVLAASIANMAAMGIPADTISTYLASQGPLTISTPTTPTLPEYEDPTIIDDYLDGKTGPVLPDYEDPTIIDDYLDGNTGPVIPDYEDPTIIDDYLDTLPPVITEPPVDPGVIIGTEVVNDTTDTSTTTPTGPRYIFTPAAPDPRWSQPLQYPGVNPGLVGAAIQPAYQTYSPVQSQYYWGRQPYFSQVEDLANYNRVPMPQQPWGTQQGFFERPVDYSQIPTYQPNMFVSAPMPAYQTTADYRPAARTTLSPVAPQTLPQPEVFGGPVRYAYDISAQPGQYTQVA